MKKLATLVFGFLLMGITSNTTANNSEVLEYNSYNPYDGRAYIFEEGGVEFSVFTDGQFDFSYVGPYHSRQVQVSAGSPHVNISFNGGYDYEMYIQYDDYGAVTQIENVAIYYDHYGRISRAGTIDIHYKNRRIVRVGGLFINYNYYGHYLHTTGFINAYNPFYVYRPWHAYYSAPFYSNCIVYNDPYRRYYRPMRYSYENHRYYYKNRNRVAYQNGRRGFQRPGSRLHYKNGRTARNDRYKSNRRNTTITDSGRRGNTAKARPLATNGKVDRNRPSSTMRGRNTSNIRSANRNSSSDLTNGKPLSSVARGSSKTEANTNKSRNRTVNRSTSSESNLSKNRSSSTNPQGRSSTRRRGL
jgi:hypothetical protein